MRAKRLLSRLRKSGPLAIATVLALSWAWLCWMRLSIPNVNDGGGWFDGFAKVFMTTGTTLCVFAMTIAVMAWIHSEVRIRRPK